DEVRDPDLAAEVGLREGRARALGQVELGYDAEGGQRGRATCGQRRQRGRNDPPDESTRGRQCSECSTCSVPASACVMSRVTAPRSGVSMNNRKTQRIIGVTAIHLSVVFSVARCM